MVRLNLFEDSFLAEAWKALGRMFISASSTHSCFRTKEVGK